MKKIRKIISSLAAGTCLMTITGSAGAAQYNVNMYGSSSQFTYWSTVAPSFLRARGCAEADIRSAAKKVDGREQSIAWCAGSVGVGGTTGRGFNGNNHDYFIRYSANASYEGIMAVQNTPPICRQLMQQQVVPPVNA